MLNKEQKANSQKLDKAPYFRPSFVMPFSLDGNHSSHQRRWSVSTIANSMKTQILADLKGNIGLRLPPVRVLAHQLFVSKNTVQEAYEELKSVGLIESRPRQGLYVTDPCSQEGIDKKLTIIGGGVSSLPLGSLKTVEKEAGADFRFSSSSQKTLFLGQNSIDSRLIPKKLLSKCLTMVAKLDPYPDFVGPQGYLPLRESIAKRLRLRGIEARAEDLIITNGTQEALDLFSRLLPEGKKRLGIETPIYGVAKRLFDFNGVKLTELPINPFEGLDDSLWQKRIEADRPSWLYLTPNFHNPTGYSYTNREMDRVMGLSRDYKMGIIEDDWGSDMLSYSEFRQGLRILGGENVLYTNSFTKKLMPSLRIGYLLGNSQVIPSFISARSLSSVAPSAIIERLLFEFLERGFYDHHLKLLHQELDKRYHGAINLLTKLMPKELKFSYPGGGPRIWLNFPQSTNLFELQKKMAVEGVYFSLESNLSADGIHGIPIGHAYLTTEEMERALIILIKNYRELLR